MSLSGLIINGPEGDVVYQRSLDDDVIKNVIAAAEELNLSVLAYATDRILVPVANEHTDRLASYKEPVPEEVKDLRKVVGTLAVQKMILAETAERIDAIRPLMMERLADSAELTTALPGLLEVCHTNILSFPVTALLICCRALRKGCLLEMERLSLHLEHVPDARQWLTPRLRS